MIAGFDPFPASFFSAVNPSGLGGNIQIRTPVLLQIVLVMSGAGVAVNERGFDARKHVDRRHRTIDE
jgi:hypothetical protein